MSELSEPPVGTSVEEIARNAPSADDGSNAQESPDAEMQGAEVEGVRQGDNSEAEESPAADGGPGAGENYAGSGF
ncbi:MAG TPA: hypothetical protein VF635_18140 [Propionibacteriaceae bacterium]|jgi:hypothetical protein